MNEGIDLGDIFDGLFGGRGGMGGGAFGITHKGALDDYGDFIRREVGLFFFASHERHAAKEQSERHQDGVFYKHVFHFGKRFW